MGGSRAEGMGRFVVVWWCGGVVWCGVVCVSVHISDPLHIIVFSCTHTSPPHSHHKRAAAVLRLVVVPAR